MVNPAAACAAFLNSLLYPEHPISVVSPRLLAMRFRFLLLPLLLAACHSPDRVAPPVAAPPPQPLGQPLAPSPAEPVAPKPSNVPNSAGSDCSAQFPQLPLTELPPQDRIEFCKFANDTLCYCGCPHTVAGCLKEHPGCHHAVRAATLGLSEIVAGSGNADAAAKFVNGYYDSFKPENRVNLPVDSLPCQGPANAPLTMVEFSDFDCPHCKAARPLFEELVKDRHDLRLCFASLPLHKNASLAAAAAEYARKKGAFWRFHDLLFDDQDARAHLEADDYSSNLVKLGQQAGLDPAGMREALADPQIAADVRKMKAYAHTLGIDGTPWVYVNGRVVPPFSADLYKLSLEDEREWIANNGHWAQD